MKETLFPFPLHMFLRKITKKKCKQFETYDLSLDDFYGEKMSRGVDHHSTNGESRCVVDVRRTQKILNGKVRHFKTTGRDTSITLHIGGLSSPTQSMHIAIICPCR